MIDENPESKIQKLRVLSIGHLGTYTVGSFFRRSLERLGNEFISIDLRRYEEYRGPFIIDRILKRILGYPVLIPLQMEKELLHKLAFFHPDVILVMKGGYLFPRTLEQLKRKTKAILVNYATDDPFRPQVATKYVREAIPIYDLYACSKKAIIPEVLAAGCSNAMFVPFGYDPVMHHPEVSLNNLERSHFKSDVVFIGGADDDRVPLIRKLTTIPDFNLHLYGGYWDRYPELIDYYRGFIYDREFRLALSHTNIAPGLVRRANRDSHSMRTFEIPACGAFMLGERTEEHLELFVEDCEAAFFSSDDEFIDKVKYYLKHSKNRQKIARAGYERITKGGNTYTDRLIQILQATMGL